MSQVHISYCDIPYEDWGSIVYCPEPHRKEVTIELETLTGQGNHGIPELNPADVAQVFSLGLSVVVLFFLLGRGIGIVLNLIRRG